MSVLEQNGELGEELLDVVRRYADAVELESGVRLTEEQILRCALETIRERDAKRCKGPVVSIHVARGLQSS